jgi:hypothetical protein
MPRTLAYARAGLLSIALLSPLVYVAYRTAGEASLVRILPLAVFVAVLQVLVWRHPLVGLEVGDRGIRLRTMWSRRLVPWEEVQRALVVEDPR